ncbi:MAG: efflux RND transporter periplasmic adaptor subunit [Micropruina sp.]|uniref:HlyD family secretion protein n=1 Tax=Micropruina sp. TaxID=2737536 RepID=UPI0039E36661
MKHKRPPIPVIIVVVLLLAGLGGWWWWSATRPAAETGLALTGQVESGEVAVAPAMAGRITAVKVAEGDRVTKGQVLVQLDTAALKLQLSQAKQGVTAAKAAVTNARDDKDATKADLRAAKARQAQAEAAVKLAEVQLGYATVKAPGAGTVVNVVGNAGANAAPGRTLLTMTDPGDLFVRVFVPETQVGQVSVGGTVKVTTDSSAETFTGTVAFVSDTAEFTPNNIDTAEQRTKLVFAVRVRIEDPSGTLKSGMPVDVRLP